MFGIFKKSTDVKSSLTKQLADARSAQAKLRKSHARLAELQDEYATLDHEYRQAYSEFRSLVTDADRDKMRSRLERLSAKLKGKSDELSAAGEDVGNVNAQAGATVAQFRNAMDNARRSHPDVAREFDEMFDRERMDRYSEEANRARREAELAHDPFTPKAGVKTKRVEIRGSMGSSDGRSWQYGDIVDVETECATRLIESGQALEVAKDAPLGKRQDRLDEMLRTGKLTPTQAEAAAA